MVCDFLNIEKFSKTENNRRTRSFVGFNFRRLKEGKWVDEFVCYGDEIQQDEK